MATSMRFEALEVKSEGTYGSDPTPGTGDGVRLRGARLWDSAKTRHQFENRRDDITTNSLIGAKPGVPKGRLVDLLIPWDMKGKGSAYAAEGDIEANPLLKACGLSVAADATGGSEKLTYSLAESSHGSCAMYGYAGGDRMKILGARGNLVIPVNAGQQGLMQFQMTGMVAADPDAQAVPSVTYDSANPPTAVGMGFSLNPGGAGAYAPVVSTIEFNLGNEIVVVEDANGADGLCEIAIANRTTPRLIALIRKDALTSYDPRALRKAITSHTIDFTLGGTQYNRLKLDCNEAYLAMDPEPVEYPGMFAGWRLTFDVKQVDLILD